MTVSNHRTTVKGRDPGLSLPRKKIVHMRWRRNYIYTLMDKTTLVSIVLEILNSKLVKSKYITLLCKLLAGFGCNIDFEKTILKTGQ